MKSYIKRLLSILFVLVLVTSWLGLDINIGLVGANSLGHNLQEDLLEVGPVINIWYGLTQTFGDPSNPQGQIAILGNVSADAVSLQYRLNGGDIKDLTIGPDGRRLENIGDFAVELFDSELNALPAVNTVEIIATDSIPNQTSVTVTVNYERYKRWDLSESSFSITNWNVDLTKAQVVDGKWNTADTMLYTTEPGYDRMVAIGDMGWQDYEVLAEIKPIGIDPSCDEFYDCGGESYTPGIGLIARWTGHTDLPAFVAGTQPKSGWLPLGAIGWYRWDNADEGRLRIYHDESTSVSAGLSTLSFGTTYMYKFRVVTMGDGSPLYTLKVWDKSVSEPSEWNLTWQGAPDDPRSGSVVLFSHHVDAEFGDVRVSQINPPTQSDIVSDDFNICTLDPAVWEFYTPVNIAQTSSEITGAFTGDAKLNISVPGGLPVANNPIENKNYAARVRQSIADEDFHVEAKFGSVVNEQYQMQGIMVEGVDPNNFMRFEFYSDGTDTFLYARSFQGSASHTYLNKKIGVAGVSPLYLRVFRSGDRWITGYSIGGSTWFAEATFPYMMDVDKIGIYAGNAIAPNAPAHTAIFDYFKDVNDNTFVDDTEQNSINLTIVGNGTVTKDPNLSSYTCGQSVSLTANAAVGYSFVDWVGDVVSTENPVSLVMNNPHNITVNFSLNRYLLSITKSGTGTGTVTSVDGINCGSDCSEEYDHGTVVTLTANPSIGSTFTGWMGGGCSGTGTCEVTMDEAKTVNATFLLGTDILIVEKAGNGEGVITSEPTGITCGDTCSSEFLFGTTVTLTAVANTGSTFVGWSGEGCSGTGTCQVDIDAIKTVTATFTLNTYPLSVTLTGEGSGSVTSSPDGINCGIDCSEVYDYGTVVTLTANPTAGSIFTGWSGGGCLGTGTCVVTMTGSKTVIANFNPEGFDVFIPLVVR